MASPDFKAPIDPACDVLIDGQSLAADLAGVLCDLRVDDDLTAPGMFIADIEGASQANRNLPALLDDARVKPGAAVTIKLGYGNRLDPVFGGMITAIEPDFDAGRPPRLRLRGYDARQRLQRGERFRTFTGATDGDVVSQIGREAGLSVDAGDSGKAHDYLVQANQSDLAFITARADAIGFEVLLRDDKLLFRRSGFDAAETATLQLNDDLLSFSASLSLAGQVGSVEMRGWSTKDKAGLIGLGASGDETAVMGNTANAGWLDQAFHETVVDRVGNHPAVDQAEIDAAAKARFNRAGLALVTAEGRVLGRTDLRVGTVVRIAGTGDRFGGRYYVVAVSHRYRAQGGYITHFTARRNAA